MSLFVLFLSVFAGFCFFYVKDFALHFDFFDF